MITAVPPTPATLQAATSYARLRESQATLRMVFTRARKSSPTRAVRAALARVVLRLRDLPIAPGHLYDYDSTFTALSLDDEGSWVWHAVAIAFSHDDPRLYWGAVEAAFFMADQGLTPEQRALIRGMRALYPPSRAATGPTVKYLH